MATAAPRQSDPADAGTSTTRRLTVRRRTDIVVVRQNCGGTSIYVLKNPVDLQYYRLLAEEYFLWQALDGTATLDGLKQAFERRFPPQSITHSELQQLVMTLHERNLLCSVTRGQGEQLLRRDRERRRKEWFARLANPLALRLRGIDPNRLLTWLHAFAGFLFTRWWLGGWGLFALGSLVLGLTHFEEIRDKLPTIESLLTPENLFGLAIAMGAVKVVHELGHGLSCKHFGGEVRELGLMMLVFTPCLYCNVSDSWLFGSKWRRVAVGLGGIYFELIIASVAVWVWWLSVPGALHDVALDVAIVCSISTFLFNANPLLRFDGYYVLSDLLEIPNLSEKCSLTLRRVFGKLCLGIDSPPDYRLPENRTAFFTLFGLASMVYRWFVAVSILIFFYTFFRQHKLLPIFVVLTLLGFLPRVVQTVPKMGKWISNPGLLPHMRRPRIIATSVVVVGLLAALSFIKIPHHAFCAAVIVAAKDSPVYAEVAGSLASVNVAPGEEVKPGTTLAQLENLDLKLEETRLRSERDEYAAKLQVLRRNQHKDRELALEIAVVEKGLAAANRLLEERSEDVRRLTIVAPAAGRVLPPMELNQETPQDGALPTWSDDPFAAKNRGCKLEEGTWICSIGDPAALEAELVIDNQYLDLVAVGQPVEIMLDAAPGRWLRGRIVELAEANLKVSPKRLANKGGGDLASKPDVAGVERPRQASYYARVELASFDPQTLRLGVRGRARILVGSASCAELLDRYLRNLFHFEI